MAPYLGLCEMRYSLRSPLFMYSSTIITYNVIHTHYNAHIKLHRLHIHTQCIGQLHAKIGYDRSH